MKIGLKNLLWLQLAYCVVGVGYNVLSYWIVSHGGAQISTKPPVFGGLVMFAYGLLLLPGYLGKMTIYRALMGLSILIYGFGGIYKHISLYAATGLEGYQSFISWLLAWTINVYGLVLNLIAAMGLYNKKD